MFWLLAFTFFYCIRGFNLESDGHPCQGLQENLHIGGGATTDGGSEREVLFLNWRMALKIKHWMLDVLVVAGFSLLLGHFH